MDITETATIEQELLTQARRQTKALETIRTILMWFAALAGLLFVIGVFYLLAVAAG